MSSDSILQKLTGVWAVVKERLWRAMNVHTYIFLSHMLSVISDIVGAVVAAPGNVVVYCSTRTAAQCTGSVSIATAM